MISTAKPGDGDGILRITATAGVFSKEEVDCVSELWDEYLQNGSEKTGYSFIVMKEGENVLGYACFGPRALTDGTYDLYWIATDRNIKRRGVGRTLMEQSEKDVAAMGGRLLVVETSGKAEYAPTRAFYEGIGYNKEAVITDFYADGDDLVIYTKKLR
jgi:ribosomal protein S18 acetylase RimI-like enzyme